MMRTIVSSPRKCITHSGNVNIKHFYYLYSKIAERRISFEIYKYIVSRFFEALVNLIVDEKFIFNMPYRMGILFLRVYKVRAIFDHNGDLDSQKTSYLIDFKKTREAVEKGFMGFIYNTSITHKHKLMWRRGMFKNRSLFYFKSSIKIGRRLYEKSKNYTTEIV